MDEVTRLGLGAVRKQGVDLVPSDVRFAAVSTEQCESTRDLATQVRIAGRREGAHDRERLVPPPVEHEAAEAGELRGGARAKRAPGPFQRDHRFGGDPAPRGGTGCPVGELHISQLAEEGERGQCMMIVLLEKSAALRPCADRLVGLA
jgi:hypothetical protein